MFGDVVALSNDIQLARVASKDGSKFRMLGSNGSSFTVDIIQQPKATRNRAVVRLVHHIAPNSVTGIRESLSMTVTLDTPNNNSIPIADLQFLASAFANWCGNATNVAKLHNGEA